MKLQRSIGFLTGTSYCVTIIIGAGILGLPGAAVQMAGVNAIYAWAFDFLLVIPLLYVFSKLINISQSAGGIADFVKLAFGQKHLYFFSQSLLLLTLVVGTAAIALVGAQYLGASLQWSTLMVSIVAAFLIMVPTAINMLGIKLGGKIQKGAALTLILFLLFVIASSFSHWDLTQALSFDPHQLTGMWKTMGLVWFAFTGVEMITFLGEEFKSPTVFIFSVVTAFLIVGFLYLGLAAATKLTVSVNDPLLIGSPLMAILRATLGDGVAKFGGMIGFLLILINQTGAIMGASRLIFSVGRAGVLLPPSIGRLNQKDVPSNALWLLSLSSVFMLCVIQLTQWPLETILFIVSQNWFILYVLAILAFIKLEKTRGGLILGILSLLVSFLFMGAFSWFLLIPLMLLLILRFRAPKKELQNVE